MADFKKKFPDLETPILIACSNGRTYSIDALEQCGVQLLSQSSSYGAHGTCTRAKDPVHTSTNPRFPASNGLWPSMTVTQAHGAAGWMRLATRTWSA